MSRWTWDCEIRLLAWLTSIPIRIPTLDGAERMKPNKMTAIDSPSETYHEASKLRSNDSSLATIYSVNNFPHVRKIIAKPATSRPGFPTFVLPKDFGCLDHGVAHFFSTRESSRAFSGAAMSLMDLAAILYFGASVTREAFDEFGIKWGFRCAPSGGALYPVDIYCAINRVVSLDAGLYFYDQVPMLCSC